MGKKSQKSRSRRNTLTLNKLHLSSIAINSVFLLWRFLPFTKSRSITAYLILSIPAFVAEYVLERTGRPVVVDGVVKTGGQDLDAQGLTEYLFDVVWVTWACLVAVLVVGNWGWLIWAVIPAFAAVKGYSLLGMARGMMAGAGGAAVEGQEAPVAGNRKQRRMAAQ